MADNTTLDPGTGGDTLRDKDRAGVKTPIVGLDLNPAGAEVLGTGDATNGLDVDVTRSALPTGAATAAKQPALGTAGVASTDVITIQGIASGTVVPVSGPLTDAQLRASAVPVDTELPAAAALADAAANPTAPAVGAFALLWNGATWDRCPGGATNGLTANLKALNGTTIDTNSGAKSAGTQRVILASDQTVVPISDNSGSLTVDAPVGTPAFVRLSDGAAAITALPVTDNAGSLTVDNAGTFVVQENGAALTSLQLLDDTIIADDAAFTVATTKVTMAGFLADQASTDSVNEGDAGAARMTLDRKQIVTVAPSADTEGWDTKNCTSGDGSTALTNSAQAIKASAGKLGGWYIYNPNATAAYIPIYNVASASVTVGTTNPLMVITIPATSAANLEMVNGIAFDTAISAAAATTAAGNTALGTALDANFFYK